MGAMEVGCRCGVPIPVWANGKVVAKEGRTTETRHTNFNDLHHAQRPYAPINAKCAMVSRLLYAVREGK